MKIKLLALLLISSLWGFGQRPPDDPNLKELPPIVSATGTHRSWIQYHQGFPVHNARLDQFFDHRGVLRWSKDQLVHIETPDQISLQHNGSSDFEWVKQGDNWVLAHWVSIDPVLGRWQLQYENDVLAEKQTKLFNHLPDSLVHAQVFLINPLNTAEKPYGTPYVDSLDRDLDVLNNERKWVTMRVEYSNGLFKLKNSWLEFGEVSDPIKAPVEQVSDTFSFTRTQYEFEDVNAFYHITNYADRVLKLGYDQLIPDSLLIDAHGYNGSDLSSFNYEVDPVELEFGEGGVDDAEDGEVVIHEFGHALSYSASPGTVEGSERAAMEEGLCDYISTSYSRQYTDYAWKQVFNWDGHNPFWGGINTGTNKVYPSDLTGNLNTNRELWSSPLMCLYDKLGRDKSDSLVFEHLFFQTKNATMPEMAKVMLMIDTLFWGGAHYYDIKECFVQHTILEWGAGVEQIEENTPFRLLNSLGFAHGTGNLSIQSRVTGDITVKVVDNTGRLCFQEIGSNQIDLDPTTFLPGIYHILIQQNDVNLSYKVIRIH